MSRALSRRVQRLETLRRTRPGLSATDEAWIRQNCDEAEFLVGVIKNALSGEFRRQGLRVSLSGGAQA